MASHADLQTDNLHESHWDCCVIGNGVAALWVSHWLWSSKKSVLWITSEEPYSPQRAMLQHAWLWGMREDQATALTERLQGFEGGEEIPTFESIYFDARSSKRFRRFNEVKADWGDHEKDFFNKQGALLSNLAEPRLVDMWDWHARLHAFHDSGQTQGPFQVELFSDPRFVRVQRWPLLELTTENGRLNKAILAGRYGSAKKSRELTISADQFFLGDFDEHLPSLIKNTADSDVLAAALKGRSYRAGFGLRLWHKNLGSYPVQTAVIPLVANPSEKGAGSHIVGRFVSTERGLESNWVGLLTDEELEDNNEILKKIKQVKRVVDRAIPGFADSIEREAVTFESRMTAMDLGKGRKTHQALGATLLSDHYGTEVAAETLKKVFGNGVGEKTKAPDAQSDAPGVEVNA